MYIVIVSSYTLREQFTCENTNLCTRVSNTANGERNNVRIILCLRVESAQTGTSAVVLEIGNRGRSMCAHKSCLSPLSLLEH